MESVFEAFISNPALYSAGHLVGETLHFPTNTEEVQSLLKRIGVDGVRCQEYFIISFDSDILGLYDYLGEYENIDELNHLAHLLKELSPSERETLEAVMDSGQHCGSVQDLINLKDVILTPEQIAAEERRWLFDAPIAELAEVKGVTVDEAVKLRTDAILQEAAVPIEVTVRPIEPQGKLIGFASVNYGGVVIDDFKVVDGKNGIFLGAPSKPDPTSRTGYRSTVRINDRATQERLNAAGAQAYHSAVEKLIARAEAVRPTPIKEQMAQAAREAGKENAARTAPAKKKEVRDDR